ncbi:EAL domain-containing protein [Massilia buxea]|uniref:EAL domain-containing protein n=2 Tax=Pseudoduganella buxea TaxID=1949069 RepID=A0A6I3SYF8_9BURK|nr:EAL domain-containing protein [Pseudoduganella buxea]
MMRWRAMRSRCRRTPPKAPAMTATVLRSWSAVLRALRPYLLFILLWPMAGAGVAAACWFILLENLDSERTAVEQKTLRATEDAARNLEQAMKRNLSMVDQVLMLIRLRWQATGTVRLGDFNSLLDPAGRPLNISIFGSDGKLRMTNARDLWPPGLLARVPTLSFFTTHLLRSADDLFIGMPQEDSIGTGNAVRLSRKLLNAAAEFDGVVAVSFATDSLVADYDELLLGQRGFLGAVDSAGVIRAFKVGAPFERMRALPRSLVQAMAAPQGNAFIGSGDFSDGRNRYVSWKAIDQFPLMVVAGADQEDALALFRARERAMYQTGIGASFALLLFVLAGMSLSVRLAMHRHRVDLAQDAYRKATEASREGFFIAAPVFGPNGRVIDYITVDCNEQGAAMSHSTRERMLGARLSTVASTIPLAPAMALLERAMAGGSAQGEIELDDGQGEGPARQVQVNAVRAGEVLAITVRDVTMEKAHLIQLERKNFEDVLTALPNRAWVARHLPQAVARAIDDGTLVALLFVDLDGFKSVNDTFGHAAGDELLQVVAKRLKVAVRPGDHVARIGGDEFIVILEHLRDSAEAAHVAGRIVQAFHAGISIGAGTATIGTSIGISICPGDAHDGDALLRHADIAMYEVKTSGKNRYKFFDPAFYGVLQQRQLRESDLRTAIRDGQFVMYYQPRVRTATMEVCSVEALVRWNHPTAGTLQPDAFIPLAEETGLIVALGELIVDAVCAQIAAWRREGYPPLPVSINVSSRQFNERDMHALFVQALQRHDVAPECVEIELTESTMLHDPGRTAQNLQAIHAMGIKLLVDDFGTGYSSLSMLQQLDFDILKVDKSFTRRLGVDRQGEILFSAIITMAHALGMKVVAEGVERREQVELLARLQCDELQGYYVARPADAARVRSDCMQRAASL